MFGEKSKSPMFSMENTHGVRILSLERIKSNPVTNRVKSLAN